MRSHTRRARSPGSPAATADWGCQIGTKLSANCRPEYVRKSGTGVIVLILFFMATALLLSACLPVSTPPVAKVGLIAPFEGPSRPLGYATLNAVRLRLNQWNDTGGLPRLELVALNDDSDPKLATQLVAQLCVATPTSSSSWPTAGPHCPGCRSRPNRFASSRHQPCPPSRRTSRKHRAFRRNRPQSRIGAGSLHSAGRNPAWDDNASPPVIWLGDPLTLSQRLQSQPDWVAAAGSVAAEQAVDAWAGEAALGLIWAGACPQSCPPTSLPPTKRWLAPHPHSPVAWPTPPPMRP